MTEKQIVTTTSRLEKTDRAHKLAYFTAMQKHLEKFQKEQEMLEEFSKWVEGKGYTTPEDFLKVGEFVRDRNKRRPRTIVSPETKDAVVEDVKAGLLKTHEIAEKYKITEASVYNIKSVRGLTKKRGTDTTTETTDTTETTETTDTTTETAEMTDTTEMTETTEMSPSPLAA